MFGKINLEAFAGTTAMPQDAASAWSAACEGLVGASYKPLLYLGFQIVNGVNHFFIAEQNVVTTPPVRRILLMTVNDNKIIRAEEIIS